MSEPVKGEVMYLVKTNSLGVYDVQKAKFVEQNSDGRIYVSYMQDFDGRKERMVVDRKPEMVHATENDALLHALSLQRDVAKKAMDHAFELALRVKMPK